MNDAPVLAGSSALTYTEQAAAVVINSVVTVNDLDNTTLGTATIAITGFVAGDVLSFVPVVATMGNIALTSNTNGVMVLTSASRTATNAQWQTALRAVKYNHTGDAPPASRTVTFVVNDGLANSNAVTSTIAITAVNDAPVLAGPSALTYTENAAATEINTVLAISDLDHTALTSATVTLTTFVAGQDALSFTNVAAMMGNIAIATNANGVLTLTSASATATVAQWQAALRAVKYANSSDAPTTTQRSVTFVVNDGLANSNTLTNTINITAVADAPTITNFADAITFTEGGAALLIDTDVLVSDLDTADTGGGVLKVYTNVVDKADRLAIRNQGKTAGLIGTKGSNVTFGGVVIGKFSGGVSTTPLTITLNSSARYASVQALLRNVTFRNTSKIPVTTARTLRVSYNNGLERIVSKTLNVIATIPQPVQNSGHSTEQPAATNPLTASPNPNTKRRLLRDAPDNTAPTALDSASAAQRRANRRRRGV